MMDNEQHKEKQQHSPCPEIEPFPSALLSSIVVVAKCPYPGKSKTRLIPLLGEHGSVELAQAMLSDVLTTLSACKELELCDKILLYAPPNPEGESTMKEILQACKIPAACFTLLPIVSSTTTNNMNSTDLGCILENALITARERQISKIKNNNENNNRDIDDSCPNNIRRRQQRQGPVIFFGMDSPEIPLNELIAVLSNSEDALILPAADGGYGMLSIPPQADPLLTFNGVLWSHPLTAISQIKALTDQSIKVLIGQLMYDVDEPDDVSSLCQRLRPDQEKQHDESHDKTDACCLNKSSVLVQPAMITDTDQSSCQYSRKVLIKLGQLLE